MTRDGHTASGNERTAVEITQVIRSGCTMHRCWNSCVGTDVQCKIPSLTRIRGRGSRSGFKGRTQVSVWEFHLLKST